MKVWLFLLASILSSSMFAQGVADAARAARGETTKGSTASIAPAKGPSSTLVAAATNGFAEPENGSVADGTYASKYFSMSYRAPDGWSVGNPGPPPSETGYYVLSSFRPGANYQGSTKGTILIAAWDLFFVPRPAHNAMELVKDMKGALPKIYSVDGPPTEMKIADRAFVRMDYSAAEAGLHWRVLATEIRCHIVEFVLTSPDTTLLDQLMQDMNTHLRLPFDADVTSGTGGAGSPRCSKDFAATNVVHKINPAMAGPRYTSVPVRFVVGADGKPKNIHVISGVPEQVKSVETALAQWTFKPYMHKGVSEEVETGVLFKFPPDGMTLPSVPEKY